MWITIPEFIDYHCLCSVTPRYLFDTKSALGITDNALYTSATPRPSGYLQENHERHEAELIIKEK